MAVNNLAQEKGGCRSGPCLDLQPSGLQQRFSGAAGLGEAFDGNLSYWAGRP